MTKDAILQELLCTVNEISYNPDVYMMGALLNDSETLKHIETLALIQSIVMQSVQANNPKRAIKYIVAFGRLLKTNTALAERLKNSITVSALPIL